MTGTFLLRISPARWLVPLLVAAELSVVFVESGPFSTEWRWGLDWAGAGLFLTGPVAAGLATWRAQAVRADRGEALSQFRSTRVLVAEAGAVAGWAVLAHLVVALAVIASCLRTGLRGVPPVGPLGLQCASLVALVALGYLVGQASASRLLPPVVAVGSFYGITAGHLPGLWFDVSGATAPLVGLAYRHDVVLGQLALYTALTALALFVTRSTGGVRVQWVGAPLALLGVLASAGWLSQTESVRFSLVASSGSDAVCYGTAPEVCLQRESALKRGDVQRVLGLLSKAAGPGAPVPSRYVQVTNGDTGTVDGRQLFMNPATVSSHGAAADLLAHYLVWNRACLLGDAPPPQNAQALLEQLSVILRVRAGLLAGSGDTAVDAFLGRPEPAQRAWIAQALEASDRCAYDDLPASLAAS